MTDTWIYENDLARATAFDADPHYNYDLPYSPTVTASYRELCESVHDLTEGLDGENSEYERGCVEMIANIFGRFQMDTPDRADEVRREVQQRYSTFVRVGNVADALRAEADKLIAEYGADGSINTPAILDQLSATL